jgi:hydrogenase small subunit
MSEVNEIPAVWIGGGTCGGCSVSVLNTVASSIKNILIDEVVLGRHISLKFHTNISGGSGNPVIKAIEDTGTQHTGGFLLIVEGVVPTAGGASSAQWGKRENSPLRGNWVPPRETM